MINFDANASNPLLDEVRDSLISLLGTSLHNASSVHQAGQRGRELIEKARIEISELLGLTGYKLVFTSGATESNNFAVQQISAHPQLQAGSACNVVVSAVEHPCVIEPIMALVARHSNIELRIASFRESVDEILHYVDRDTVFISVMGANNETGEIYDLREFFNQVKSRSPDALTHSDCVQVIGKIHLGRCIDSANGSVDLISISGHKFGALMGIGALFCREQPLPLILGGGQERWMRAGTENLLGIYSLMVAMRTVMVSHDNCYKRLESFRLNALQKLAEIGVYEAVSSVYNILPNTLCVRVPKMSSKDLVVALDLMGVLVSSGSACSSGKVGESRVLINRGLEKVSEILRISFPLQLSEDEYTQGLDLLVQTIARRQA